MIRHILTLALVITLVGATVACTSSNPVAPGAPGLHFVSAFVCSGCHIKIGDSWKKTNHARALTDLESAGPLQQACVKCHVTGLDGNPANSGYDDPNPNISSRFAGVQCETCHGMASQHLVDFIPPQASLGADLCGGCHDGPHHPTFTEWKTSLHAVALDARDKSKHFTTGCLQCHSADYRLAKSIPDNATPQDFKFGLTCVVCHDPHSKTNDFQLRTNDIATLCAECHNDEGAIPGQSAHHSTGNMFLGNGGAEYPGRTYTNSAHTSNKDGCASCHMYTAPTDPNNATAISGHTFKPRIEACQKCHPGLTTFDRYGAQTQTHQLLDQLKAKLDAATDADKATLEYQHAKFNYDFVVSEGSYGIHNHQYATELLEDSLDNFNPTP